MKNGNKFLGGGGGGGAGDVVRVKGKEMTSKRLMWKYLKTFGGSRT